MDLDYKIMRPLDHKVDAHTASSVKQRKPAITKVARSFNALCDTIEDLFRRGKAPPGTTCPKKLDIKGIFALDVDDTIWEDLGLDKGSLVPPPPWLSDEGVQAVNSLDFGDLASLPDWGPSTEDIINFRIAQKTAVIKEVLIVDTEGRDTERIIELERQERDEESEYSDSENGEADIILFDILDAADAPQPGEEDEEYIYDL
ncbi:hypothetical protein DXG01_015538 [Tephrocybe rancida]|nr:hypothetical protein DXG01_015538 [Tephrocybe rancida]